MPRAMLVAAGFGTRLAPLTDELPKPAVPVANRPLAWFAMDHLHRSGIDDFVANTHHLAAPLRRELGACAPPGVSLRFSHEERIVGTGGGLRRAWDPRDDEAFVVMNAKLVFEPNISALLEEHRRSSAIATMVLAPVPPDSAFGGVDVDREGRVRAILADGPPRTGLTRRMFTGVHVLHSRAWNDLPEDGCIIRVSYRAWLLRGEKVMSVLSTDDWADHGITPQHYAEGNMRLLSGARRWPGVAPTPEGVLIAEGAEVGAGCQLEQCAIGAGAVIDPGIRLRQCVVWPGARVQTDLARTIVTTRGIHVPF